MNRYCTTLQLMLSTLVAIALSTSLNAEVAIFDGFGDADINNNGIPLESADVDVGGSGPNGVSDTYSIGRLKDDLGDGPANPEVTEVLDASDTGIRWLMMRGYTSGGTGEAKPRMRIVDDSAGVMQELSDFGVPAIDSGYAMSWESKGGGSSSAGFFDKTIELGPEVGDEVKVHFDFRIWRDAPNVNGGIFELDNNPEWGQLNFGLYQDTDNQLGLENPFAGPQLTDEDGNLIGERSPAVWGQDEGRFDGGLPEFGDGDEIGALGDNGWIASVSMDERGSEAGNGQFMYIEEEVNDGRIFQGSDRQDIFENESVDHDGDPFTPPIYQGFDLESLDTVYNFELSLKRATDVDPGDTILATLNMTDKATGEVLSVSGLDPVADDGGPQSESWDYFAITNRSSGNGEFDFLLDNFTVEVLGSNASVCNPNTMGDIDGNGEVGFSDFLILSNNFGEAAIDHTTGDIDCDGEVAFADFLTLSNNFGNSVGPTQSVPEPAGFAMLTMAGLIIGGLRRRRVT